MRCTSAQALVSFAIGVVGVLSSVANAFGAGGDLNAALQETAAKLSVPKVVDVSGGSDENAMVHWMIWFDHESIGAHLDQAGIAKDSDERVRVDQC